MCFYSVEAAWGDDSCVWLAHENQFSRAQWLAFIRAAVAAIDGKVTTTKIIGHLCKTYGFTVFEPIYSVWVDPSLKSGETHFDEANAFAEGRTRYVEIISDETLAERREKRDLQQLCAKKAKYKIGQRVHVGDMEKPLVDDDGLTFCWTQNRDGVIKNRELRDIDGEVRYHIVFDDFQCDKCFVQCWINESDLSPARA